MFARLMYFDVFFVDRTRNLCINKYFHIWLFVNQVACLGIHFNFKMDYQYARIYCTALMLIVISLVSIIFYIFLMTIPSLKFQLLLDQVSAFMAYIIPSAISLSFNAMLWRLYKRFAALNKLLKLRKVCLKRIWTLWYDDK